MDPNVRGLVGGSAVIEEGLSFLLGLGTDEDSSKFTILTRPTKSPVMNRIVSRKRKRQRLVRDMLRN